MPSIQRLSVVLLVLLAATTPLAAQALVAYQDHPEETPAALTPRSRELAVLLDRLRERIHETNRWMVEQGSPEGFHGVGTQLAHAGEQMQELIRRMDEVYRDPEVAGNVAMEKAADRLRDRLVELERQLDQTYEALRAGVEYR